MVGLIRRSLSSLDGRLFKKLFTEFVRPHLDYSHVISATYLSIYLKKCSVLLLKLRMDIKF